MSAGETGAIFFQLKTVVKNEESTSIFVNEKSTKPNSDFANGS